MSQNNGKTQLKEIKKFKRQKYSDVNIDNPASITNLALLYEYGLGVPQNPHEAIRLYRQAAEHGEPVSMYMLGVKHYHGAIGVPKDMTEAAKWFSKAAEKDYPLAQVNIGYLYLEGIGVEQNLTEAAGWFSRAAKAGNPVSQHYLAYCHDTGKGVPKDPVQTEKWLRLAANQGLASARHYLGILYLFGGGTDIDKVESEKWLSMATEQGDENAEISLYRTRGKFYSTTTKVTAVLLQIAYLGYWLLPIDFIPDAVPILGKLDDILINIYGLLNLLEVYSRGWFAVSRWIKIVRTIRCYTIMGFVALVSLYSICIALMSYMP